MTTDRADALSTRLFDATIGALELYAVALGIELGLYRALADQGPSTPAELAARAHIGERYAREWLEQQAVAGMLSVDDEHAPAAERRYALGPGHARALVGEGDPAHTGPLALLVAGIGGALTDVAHAYRTGGGVPYARYGAAFRLGQGLINRPVFERELPGAWLDAMTDIRARLQQPGARIADVGCGEGFATIALARAFPDAVVVGLDADAASIEEARERAHHAGVHAELVCADATDLRHHGPFALVVILETLHDLSHPVDALRAARAALEPGGAVLVVDERVADVFHAPGDAIERMMYGWSVTHCLPTALVDAHAAGTGTVMRTDTLRDYARRAGLRTTTVLPVENDLFRLYRLDP